MYDQKMGIRFVGAKTNISDLSDHGNLGLTLVRKVDQGFFEKVLMSVENIMIIHLVLKYTFFVRECIWFLDRQARTTEKQGLQKC